MKKIIPSIRILSTFLFFFVISCSNDSDTHLDNQIVPGEQITGSGFFEYSDYQPLVDKIIKVYFHIPEKVSNTSPILFVFHGSGRNADDYRDAMISKANQYNFIVIAPEFSNSFFPGGDGYNLGNVFIDGDNPSSSSLNSEEEWTFSVIEPLFDFVKDHTNNSSTKYHVFGHSAGGQFAHRFIMFKPNARFDKVVSSGSGWYTAPDVSIDFPYGFNNSPLENILFESLLSKKLIIQIGDLDNDPNSPAFRHNYFTDAQGINRLERASHFFNEASQIADSNNIAFNWEFYINNGANHDFVMASESAAEIIFN